MKRFIVHESHGYTITDEARSGPAGPVPPIVVYVMDSTYLYRVVATFKNPTGGGFRQSWAKLRAQAEAECARLNEWAEAL